MDADIDTNTNVMPRRVGLVLLGALIGGITGIFLGLEGYLRAAILFLCTLDALAVLEQMRVRSVWLWAAGGVAAGLLAGSLMLLFSLDETPLHGIFEYYEVMGRMIYYCTCVLIVYRVVRKGWRWRIPAIALVFGLGYMGGMIRYIGNVEPINALVTIMGLSFLNALVFAVFWYTFASAISNAGHKKTAENISEIPEQGEGPC